MALVLVLQHHTQAHGRKHSNYLKLNELENQLLLTPCNGFPRSSRPTIVQLGKNKRKRDMDKWHVQKTRGKFEVTCCRKRKGITVTSACDLGETCHLGLNLLHAVIAQGMALLQQAHACTKFHHCFQQSTTVKLQRVLYAPPGD